jgi:hypothetical protein
MPASLAFALAIAACSSSRGAFDREPTPGSFGSDAGPAQADALAPAACTGVSLAASHRPLDLFITLDRSGSMAGVPWKQCKLALESFFASPPSTEIAAALTYFPNGASCDRNAYQLFSVGIGPLPARAPELTASLERTDPSGGTPTGVALDGALFTATQYKLAHADHQVAVVLVSDGLPNACTDEATLTTLPKIAFTEYGTLTFAIGIGTEPGAVMDAIAAAGGTGQALSVANPSEIDGRLREAQVQAVACELLIPATTPDGRAISPDLVNLLITDNLGARTVRQVDRLATCGNREGWYYDDPKAPKSIRLCPASCDLVKSRKEAKADVQFGCKTVGPR